MMYFNVHRMTYVRVDKAFVRERKKTYAGQGRQKTVWFDVDCRPSAGSTDLFAIWTRCEKLLTKTMQIGHLAFKCVRGGERSVSEIHTKCTHRLQIADFSSKSINKSRTQAHVRVYTIQHTYVRYSTQRIAVHGDWTKKSEQHPSHQHLCENEFLRCMSHVVHVHIACDYCRVYVEPPRYTYASIEGKKPIVEQKERKRNE